MSFVTEGRLQTVFTEECVMATATTTQVDRLLAQQTMTFEEMQQMLDTAKREGRAFSADEEKKYAALKEQATAFDARIKEAQGDQTLMTRLDQITGGAATRPSGITGVRTGWGDQFVASAQYQEFIKAQGHRRSGAWTGPVIELQATALTEAPASGGALVPPDLQPGVVPLPMPPVVVRNLFAQGQTSSNIVAYVKEKTFTNAAGGVLETALKGESTLTYEQASTPIETYAHWIPVSVQMAEDAPNMAATINNKMADGLGVVIEHDLLNGTGVSPQLTGILTRPGLAPPVAKGTDTAIDAIAKQAAAIRTATKLVPDAVVLNPVNALTINLGKDTAGNYIIDTDLLKELWGVRSVVQSPAVPAGTALVGSFATGGAQLFLRGPVRIEISNSHADYFVKNLLAVRVEQRLALAVLREAAFGIVTGLT